MARKERSSFAQWFSHTCFLMSIDKAVEAVKVPDTFAPGAEYRRHIGFVAYRYRAAGPFINLSVDPRGLELRHRRVIVQVSRRRRLELKQGFLP